MGKKLVFLVCLCVALLGVPVAVSGCSSDMGLIASASPSYAANGSVQFPYPLALSKGKCTNWSVVLDSGAGLLLCAKSLPTQHVGQYVQVSYSGVPQNMAIASINVQKHIVHLW